MVKKLLPIALLVSALASVAAAQPASSDDKATEVIVRSIRFMGGDKYLKVTSQVGRGSFSSLRQGGVTNYQSFSDAIVFPDRERTDFKGSGARTTQVNTGDTGWVFDGDQQVIKIQTPEIGRAHV